MDRKNKYIIVYTTFPDTKTAKVIITGLVSEGLAACGNMFEIDSIYRWKGKIEQESEIGVFIKTKASCYNKVEKYIKEHHPYEVPEIISWTIANGSPQYLEWIDQGTLPR